MFETNTLLPATRHQRAWLNGEQAQCVLCGALFNSRTHLHAHRDMEQPFETRECVTPAEAQARLRKRLKRARHGT